MPPILSHVCNNNGQNNDNGNNMNKFSAGLLNIRCLTVMKSNYIIDTISVNDFDFLALTEIWGEDKITTVRALATPP